jgi:hypothetical protein
MSRRQRPGGGQVNRGDVAVDFLADDGAGDSFVVESETGHRGLDVVVGLCVHPSGGKFVSLAEFDRFDISGGCEFCCKMDGVLICVLVCACGKERREEKRMELRTSVGEAVARGCNVELIGPVDGDSTSHG